eukprot:913935_1
MNAASHNIGVNGNYPSGQMMMQNHSLINHNTFNVGNDELSPAQATETSINSEINSLVHQQMKHQLMQDARIYERIRNSHNMKQLRRQEADMKQREGYVPRRCNCKFCNQFANSVPNQVNYSIISELDRGSCSRVFKCRRMDNNCVYAMKLIQKTAMQEMDILKRIKANDLDDTSCCVHIVDVGVYSGH